MNVDVSLQTSYCSLPLFLFFHYFFFSSLFFVLLTRFMWHEWHCHLLYCKVWVGNQTLIHRRWIGITDVWCIISKKGPENMQESIVVGFSLSRFAWVARVHFSTQVCTRSLVLSSQMWLWNQLRWIVRDCLACLSFEIPSRKLWQRWRGRENERRRKSVCLILHTAHDH